MDANGRELAALLEETGLCLPQTYEGNAAPGAAHTWSSRAAGQHRIYYVAVPCVALADSYAEV
eukprot:9080472-Lingulodinium_polyedra.AAC.1